MPSACLTRSGPWSWLEAASIFRAPATPWPGCSPWPACPWPPPIWARARSTKRIRSPWG
ncbi:Uncharacterised protein [Bordetella pertussis]|nr:Uncharacterised protein [Bordetella pertussis]